MLLPKKKKEEEKTSLPKYHPDLQKNYFLKVVYVFVCLITLLEDTWVMNLSCYKCQKGLHREES